MRIAITLLILAPALADVAASPPRVARPASDLRLVFLDGDGREPVRQTGRDAATVEVGRVVAGRCLSRGCSRTVIRKRFRLRVDGRSPTGRFVRVRAYLDDAAPGQRVRVDGRLLSATPQLIDAAAPLGVPVAHTVEIEVATTAPPGALARSIVWIAEDDR